MKNKYFILLFLILFFFSFVSSKLEISQEGVVYDSKISDKFYAHDINYQQKSISSNTNEEWVEVGISFKDNSGVELVGTKEEKLAQIKLKDEWFDMEINNFIGNLSDDEYEIIGRVSNGLSLNISRYTFDKIIKDERIEKVELPTYGTIQHTNGENNKSYYWVFVSVILLLIFFILLIKFYRGINEK